jgi:hypothetical protein
MTDLEYASLLPSNFSNRFAKDANVIETEGCDASNNGLGHEIGAIIGPPYTYFENGSIHLTCVSVNGSNPINFMHLER